MYEVVYQFTDLTGQLVTAVTTVTVVASADNGTDGEAPLPGQPTEPEAPETPEAPEAPSEPEAPVEPETPSEPEAPEDGQTASADDASGLTSSNVTIDRQDRQSKIAQRYDLSVNSSQPLRKVISEQKNFKYEQKGMGLTDARYHRAKETSLQLDEPTTGTTKMRVVSQLPQTGEPQNRISWVGAVLLIITSFIGIITSKQRQG